ncbi:MAG TPA: hypothetical protein VII03_01590 [Solirubrobacteraceae bacterium]
MAAILLLSAAFAFALAGAANAAVPTTESQITEPGEPTFASWDMRQVTLEPFLTIQGTANGEGPLDIRCYYLANGAEHSTLIASSVTLSGGRFGAAFPPAALYGGPCVLRAVPAGDLSPHPPGSSSDPFRGPQLAGTTFALVGGVSHEVPVDYELDSSTLAARLELRPSGVCGISRSSLYAPQTLAESNGMFICNAAIHGDLEDQPQPRTALLIDGANAYTPSTAERMQNLLGFVVPGPAPALSVARSFDLASGLSTIHEVDPIVRCEPEAISPPTSSSCKGFGSTGVALERSWQTSHGNEVAQMTDRWISTDGAAHTLDALYLQELEDHAGGLYEFPGTSVFAATSSGQSLTLPGGSGEIFYKSHAATPDQGDSSNPQGAIVYDAPPSRALSVTSGSGEAKNGFYMPYALSIPAGGSRTLRMSFIQAFALADVRLLADQAASAYAPSLAITSPLNGTTVNTRSVTVTGTAADSGALASVSVDGASATLASDGNWASTVALDVGSNVILATATDQAGLTTSVAITVSYIPPMPHVSRIGALSGAGGKVTMILGCAGAPGTRCEVSLSLMSTERLRGRRLVGLAARSLHTRKVTVGAYNTTIAAGVRARVTVKLNRLGRRLLARFGRLPVHLDATLTNAGVGQKIVAQNLTIRPLHGHRPLLRRRRR